MTDFQQLYDRKYSRSQGQRRHLAIWHHEILKLLATQPRSQRLLDLGCGNGRLLQAIAAMGFEAEGVDVSAEAVALCRAKGLRAQTMDVSVALTFNAEFDICVSAEVIEHVFDPYRFFGQINRLLKPGGLAIVTTPNFAYYVWTWRYLRGQTPSQIQHPYHIRFFTASFLAEIARAQGFEVVSLHGGVARLAAVETLAARVGLAALWRRFTRRWGKSLIAQFRKTGEPRFTNIDQVYEQWSS